MVHAAESATGERRCDPGGTVWVVDDEHHMRESLKMLLEAEGLQARAFRSAEAVLEAFDREAAPGCLLIDLRLDGMSGIELQQRLGQWQYAPPAIIITGHGDVSSAVRALKAGAVDFLEKPLDNAEVLQRVTACLTEGERRARAAQFAARVGQLTPREREVMELLVDGHSNKSVAQTLDISPRTAEAHRAQLMDKLEVRSLAELVRLVFELKRYGISSD